MFFLTYRKDDNSQFNFINRDDFLSIEEDFLVKLFKNEDYHGIAVIKQYKQDQFSKQFILSMLKIHRKDFIDKYPELFI
jgi:hypothetical protein